MVDEHLNLHIWNPRDQNHANREQDLFFTILCHFWTPVVGEGEGEGSRGGGGMGVIRGEMI